MFNTICLIPDAATASAIEKLAIDSKQVVIDKIFDHYPQPYELVKILNTFAPDLVFIDLSNWDAAVAAAVKIHGLAPYAAIIGFGAGWDGGREIECAQAGITELLVSPVTTRGFLESIDRAIHKLHGSVFDNLLAFLPGKAGSGCTTVVLNLAARLAEVLHLRVLVIEADLHSGVLSELLDCKAPYSVVDALENCAALDYSLWTSYVVQRNNVDLLLANRARKKSLPLWSNYHHLLDFVQVKYDMILVDLPEVVNDATVEIVRRSKGIFVVCTPESPSLGLAHQRCSELKNRWVAADRIHVLVNRWRQGDTKISDIEHLLGHSVAGVFGNDYLAVQKANKAHTTVRENSELGKSYLSFVKKLAGVAEPPAAEPARSPFGFLKGFPVR